MTKVNPFTREEVNDLETIYWRWQPAVAAVDADADIPRRNPALNPHIRLIETCKQLWAELDRLRGQ